MPHRYYDPPQLRYLKARLSILQKPAVWRSGFFLLISIIAWQYSSNPNFLAQKKDSTSKPITSDQPQLNISSESQSIAADIDNIPVLLDDFQKATLSNRAIISNQFETENNQDLLKPVMAERTREEDKSKTMMINNQSSSLPTDNQFIVEADNLLRFSADNSKNQSLPINNISNISQSGNELTNLKTNINWNNSYPSLQTSSVISNHSTVPSSNSSSNYSVNNSDDINNINNNTNTINTNTINNSNNNSNLGTQTFVPSNNVGNIQPIVPNINTQPANIPVDSSKIINNNTSLPVNSSIPNNTAIPNSNIPGSTSNYTNNYSGMTQFNQFQPSNQPSNTVTPGY